MFQSFYRLIPFEIANRPVTVVENDQDRLLVLLSSENEVLWLDMISDYGSQLASQPED